MKYKTITDEMDNAEFLVATAIQSPNVKKKKNAGKLYKIHNPNVDIESTNEASFSNKMLPTMKLIAASTSKKIMLIRKVVTHFESKILVRLIGRINNCFIVPLLYSLVTLEINTMVVKIKTIIDKLFNEFTANSKDVVGVTGSPKS